MQELESRCDWCGKYLPSQTWAADVCENLCIKCEEEFFAECAKDNPERYAIEEDATP
jgi:hypothetical protein